MRVRGRDAISQEQVEIRFDRAISRVDPVPDSDESPKTFLTPGFIDLQVNGFAGVDFNSLSCGVEDIERALAKMFSTGVTRCFPTLITASPEALIDRLRVLSKARSTLLHGHAMEGFHVEGPHISSEDAPRGAHPKQWVRPPDLDEYRRWQEAADGQVRIITLAPEWPGALGYIEHVTREGVVVSIGHTHATPEQIHDAVSAGATMSTHLGNAAGSRHRHDPFIEQQLKETRLNASFIVDGHHLPDEFLRRAIAAKGMERCVLITDAVAPAMCDPGQYSLGGVDVELRNDGRVTLRGGDRLAGSSLRMDRAVRNAVRDAGVTLPQAIVMATANAARAGRVPGRLRGLQPGERADLILFETIDGQIEVVETYIGGQRVFKRAAPKS